MTTRPRVQQWEQSGATDGQVATFSASLGYWAPATPAPVTVVRATALALGGESVIYLGGTPLASSDQVWVNGLLLTFGVDYVLSGTVITLTAALTAGQRIVVAYFGTGTVGIPAFGPRPTGFTRPAALNRTVRRFHRIR